LMSYPSHAMNLSMLPTVGRITFVSTETVEYIFSIFWLH
jgi:hypothetical protein